MKFLLFFSIAVGCSAAAPFAPKNAAVLPTKVLSMPRGGGGVFGTDVTKENLAALFIAIKAVNGGLAYAAPEFAADKLYNIKGVEEGSLDGLWWEYFGSTALGSALMIYLSVFKDYEPAKAVMWGGVGCFFVTFRHLLKGTFSKNGFTEGFGAVQFTLMASLLYMIATGKGDTDMIAKIFVAAPAITSTVTTLDLDTGAKLYGLPAPTGSTRTIFAWMHEAVLLVWCVMAGSLLQGVDPIKAVGYAALVKALAMADTFFVRKVAPDTPATTGYLFTALTAILGLGMVLDEGGSKVKE
jgi:hypothetical protein